MKINLKNLLVQTMSGVVLGNVKNIILETEGQTVLQYEVGNLFAKKYLISREQVLSIDDQKMIVDDSAVKPEEKDIRENKINIEPEGVAMDQSL